MAHKLGNAVAQMRLAVVTNCSIVVLFPCKLSFAPFKRYSRAEAEDIYARRGDEDSNVHV
jgi:hypothetical protein